MHFKHEDGDEDRLPQLQIGDAVGAGGELCMDEMEAAEVPVAVDANENVNEERALVLYRPVPHHHLNPESNPGIGNLSLSVPSHLIPALTVRGDFSFHLFFFLFGCSTSHCSPLLNCQSWHNWCWPNISSVQNPIVLKLGNASLNELHNYAIMKSWRALCHWHVANLWALS